ncbi:hypothetical protein C8R44DRAFT_756640 [Mycena epipterygia]|nr:hypothetical protein C8R44DRAFT_756640 [Mycena epipterygia]
MLQFFSSCRVVGGSIPPGGTKKRSPGPGQSPRSQESPSLVLLRLMRYCLSPRLQHVGFPSRAARRLGWNLRP